MAEKNSTLIEYEDKIRDIPIKDIDPNELNPRERFVESEEDELIESVLSKGILNPLIVFKKRSTGKYILLDGERRYKACLKLNIQKIPAHVLKREPTVLENISTMFHIHNVREEWTDFAISLSLKRVIEEMGKNIQNMKASDISDLKKITSLSEYKLKKYLVFHEYPTDVIDIFFESEKKEKPDKGVDPDILVEMRKPIKEIEKQMPELIKEYPIKTIIRACIDKKAHNIIERNKDFRLLSKALTASKKGEIRKEVLKDKIADFIKNVDVSPNDVFKATSEVVYQFKAIIKNSKTLYEEIANIDTTKMSHDEMRQLKKELDKLVGLVNEKILNNNV